MANLKISNFKIESLLAFEVRKEIGEHSFCNFKALVKDDNLDKYFDNLGKDVVIKKGKLTLFSGYIHNIEIEKLNGNSLISVEAVSASFKLDITKQTRVFQNTKKTYADIVKELKISDVNIQFLDSKVKSKIINYPIIQLDETDFKFLKRIFMKEEVLLLVDDLSESKKSLWIGSKNRGTEKQIEQSNYRLKKNSHKKVFNLYLHTVYELQTEDIIRFNNNKLKILNAKIFLKNATLHSEFTLIDNADKTYLKHYKEDNYNELLNGKNFICEVVDNKDKENKGRIQLKFGIDNDKKNSENFWFKYVTPYLTGDTGFFFTPEIGDKILVYFQTEEHPIGLTSIRSESNSEYFANPNEKYIKNNFEREIHLGEKEINIIFKKDEKFVKMNDEQILIKNDNTHFKMEKDTIVIGNQNVSITLNENLEISSKGKISFSSNNDTNIKGSNLYLKGDSKVGINGSSEVSIKGGSVKLN